MAEIEFHENHWLFDGFKQRLTKKQWKEILLNHKEKGHTKNGYVHHFEATDLGYGVVEIELVRST